MYKKNYLWLCFIITIHIKLCCSRQLYLLKDETCPLPDNRNGTCRLLSECPTVKLQLEIFNIKPITCSFQGLIPIVCCEDAVQGQIKKDYVAGDSCILKNGNSGICTDLVDCDFGTNTIHADDWNWCDPNRRYLICCHKRYPKHITACSRYKSLYGITDWKYVNVIYSKQDEEVVISGGFAVGGTPAEYGEFPHMALIGFGTEDNKVWACGGTLITENFVLTAAHCLYLQSLGDAKFVRLGELDLSKKNKKIQPQDFNIVESIPHPDYEPPLIYNDIALLKLDRNVSFSKFIHPACLYDKYKIPLAKLDATGWGATEYLGDFNNILLKVELSLYTYEECYPHYDLTYSYNRTLPRGIDNSTHVCSGGRGEYKDTCQGDSGGPLQMQNQLDLPYVIGVTSFGKACAIGNSPGVYTRVSAFVPWIENIVWP